MGEMTRSAPAATRIARLPGRRHHARRWLLGALGVLVVLAGAFYIGGGLYFAGEIDKASLLAADRIASSAAHDYAIPVVSRDGSGAAGTITLSLTPDMPEVTTEAVWGVGAADAGYGQILHIVSTGSTTVTWEFRQITGPAIRAGEKLWLDHDSFPGDPLIALGIPYENVTVQGPLGAYPAWFIPGTTPDWAILVHGNGMLRTDELEPMAPIHRAGLPMLVITYRNDVGAPAAADGRLHYGLTEYKDLEAAVRYALEHGARHVMLVGRSMGGAVVAAFLEHSPLAFEVSATVLDSPMLSFSRTVDWGASQRTLPLVGLPIPGSLVATAKWIADRRYGIDWNATDYLAGDSKLTTPILLFQGTADKTVPPATSDQLSKDRPDLVTYIVTPGAGHLDSWNLNRGRYESSVQSFAAAHAAD